MQMRAAVEKLGKPKPQAVAMQDSEGLRLTAKYVEDTAYDLAARVDSELISEMIVLAAELERIAKVVDFRLTGWSASNSRN